VFFVLFFKPTTKEEIKKASTRTKGIHSKWKATHN